MLSKVVSCGINGMEARPVIVETDISRGLPSINIIGLGDATVKEAAARMKSGVRSSGLFFPDGRTTINLSPAWLKKKGSHYDLAMTIGILASSHQVFDGEISEMAFLGELALGGEINRCKGIMPMVRALRDTGIKKVIVPAGSIKEAGLVEDIQVLGAAHLRDVVAYLNLKEELVTDFGPRAKMFENSSLFPSYDEIKGQEAAKRAMVIAASGCHGVLMMGSPGTGKTMMAERLPYIMPGLTKDEVLELTAIYSFAGLLDERKSIITERPFRNPGISTTIPGLLGSGNPPVPGEITLAHKGILFLDELGERPRDFIDALRIPLESKNVIINRWGNIYKYPADFMLVAASNPCKCGYNGDSRRECTCTQKELMTYRTKLSGPIMTRIDIHLELSSPVYSDFVNTKGITGDEMKEMVIKARDFQNYRIKELRIEDSICEKNFNNGDIPDKLIDKVCPMDSKAEALMKGAYERMKLEPRSLVKTRKIARTIADLEESDLIKENHIAEALQFRRRALRQ